MDAFRRGDLHRTAESISKEKWSTIDVCDHHAIVARSKRSHGHDRLELMGHDPCAIGAIRSTSHRIKRSKNFGQNPL